MSFEVQPDAVQAAGVDFVSLANNVLYLRNTTEEHIQVDPGGTVLTYLSDEVDVLRTDLVAAYAVGGPLEQLLMGAGTTLQVIAGDYQSVDKDAAADFDAGLKHFDDVAPPWQPQDDPGIDQWGYAKQYLDGPEDAFESYDAFMNISDSVDSILDFSWIGDVLGNLGLPDPIAPFKADLEGDWSKVGRALGGLRLVKNLQRDIQYDLDGIRISLDGKWEGNAAYSFYEWMRDVDDKLGSHTNSVGKAGSRVKAEALAMKGALNEATSALDTLVEAIPSPSDLGEMLTGGVTAALSKLWGYITLLKDCFDLALVAAQAIVAGFAQIARLFDTEFPAIPSWDAPDVNGPGR